MSLRLRPRPSPSWPTRMIACALLALPLPLASIACNGERKQECDSMLSAMKPLDDGTPSAEVVDSVAGRIKEIHFQDQPLGVYAENYGKTLVVLSNTLKLKASGAAPDGTDDVIKQRLKQARTDREDVQRHCSQ